MLDIDQEGFAVHRPIQDEGCDQPVAAQAGRERGGLPMPEGRLADQPLAAAATPVGADHLGRGSGLVDEDQPGRIKERWRAFQRCLASATWGRSCSAACRVFFEAHAVPLEEAINRTVRGPHPAILPEPLHDLCQSQVRLLGDQLQQPCRMRLQRRAAFAVPPSRADASRLFLQLHPPDRGRRAHRKPLGSRRASIPRATAVTTRVRRSSA